jgi:hypothetical protein
VRQYGQRSGGPRSPRQRSKKAISDRYSGIEQAQFVVVNVRDHRERGPGLQLSADLIRPRRAGNLFNVVFGFRGSRTPITAIVANLAWPAASSARLPIEWP